MLTILYIFDSEFLGDVLQIVLKIIVKMVEMVHYNRWLYCIRVIKYNATCQFANFTDCFIKVYIDLFRVFLLLIYKMIAQFRYNDSLYLHMCYGLKLVLYVVIHSIIVIPVQLH